jgi:PIN domain nuclease of toxin-antitoxin system
VILLDTHVWVWWVARPESLSNPARDAIAEAREQDGLWVSSISSWEVALLVRKGRLELTLPVADWLAATEALPFLRFLPVENRIALRANDLPGTLHDDPADRIIAATALIHGLKLVTKDRKLIAYPEITTIW